jgi:arylformamidase
VYLDYDQDALDRAYDQAPWAPNQAEVSKRRDQKRALARARLGSPQRFSYGATEIEGLDVYATQAKNAPVHVFIHGGTWRFRNAAEQIDLAEMNVDAGATFVAVDFTNVNDTQGDIVPMAQQVRRAVAWVYEHAERFGADSDRVYVSGHSSGAHLAGVVVTTDWASEYGLPRDLVKGGFLLSGMYDLYPVSLSSRQTYVNFTDEVIRNLSPQRHIDKLVAPVTVAYGTQETPEFQRQSRDFAAAIAAAGKPVTLVVAEGYNHFEGAEDMANPYGVIGRGVLRQMGF